jgi:glycosyltransferase involved in cell wall biosynthesis
MAAAHGARQVHTIPHFFEPVPLPDHAETARFRERIGAGQGTVLFGIFGYLRETKRIATCIRAFRTMHAARPNTALLLAGEAVSADLKRLLLAESPHPAILRMGHLNEQELLTAAAAVDCCLNLRSPAAGETSGIAIRLMGFGKPVILTDCPENSVIPQSACLRVSPGLPESDELYSQMSLVTEFPHIAKEIGAAARRHILEQHSIESCAAAYAALLAQP